MGVLTRSILAAFLVVGATPPAALAIEPVDVELVLAVDVSRSVDEVEAQLQRQGYVEAFRNPRIIRAIANGPLGRIGVTYVEWAAVDFQRHIIGWTLIEDEASARAFADRLAASPRQSWGWTSVSGAIDFSVPLFGQAFEGTRQVIDISGDGRNNSGRPAAAARDEAVAKGITINGLAIMNDRTNFGRPPDRELDAWYRENVIGGPGAFLAVAEDFEAFGEAVLNKLLKEIADQTDIPALPGGG
ncbi:hypothetical protein STVA_23920 [Allostella vacuolata]|nr:hypothetical protein STVA_23920 [Stella vacuolata]